MSMAHIFKHIVEVLWTLGGIGAAADLGLDDFGPTALGLGWGEACPAAARCDATTLENEPCRKPGLSS